MRLGAPASPAVLVVAHPITCAVVSRGDVIQAYECNRWENESISSVERQTCFLIPQALKTLPEKLEVLSNPPSKTRITAAPHIPSSYMCLPNLHTTWTKQPGEKHSREGTLNFHRTLPPSTWTNHNMRNHSQPQGCFSNSICFCRRTSASRVLATLAANTWKQNIPSSTGKLQQASSAIVLQRSVYLTSLKTAS